MTEPSRALVEAAKRCRTATEAQRAANAAVAEAWAELARVELTMPDVTMFVRGHAFEIADRELAAESAQPSGGPL